MRGVDRQRREGRQDVAVEARRKLRAIGLVQLFLGFDHDAFLGQGREELVAPTGLLGVDQGMRLTQDSLQEFTRRRVRGGLFLLHEAGHADLEELVQVGADDGKEADALQQRDGFVFREFQHASIEGEPTEFAIKHRRKVVRA